MIGQLQAFFSVQINLVSFSRFGKQRNYRQPSVDGLATSKAFFLQYVRKKVEQCLAKKCQRKCSSANSSFILCACLKLWPICMMLRVIDAGIISYCQRTKELWVENDDVSKWKFQRPTSIPHLKYYSLLYALSRDNTLKACGFKLFSTWRLFWGFLLVVVLQLKVSWSRNDRGTWLWVSVIWMSDKHNLLAS